MSLAFSVSALAGLDGFGLGLFLPVVVLPPYGKETLIPGLGKCLRAFLFLGLFLLLAAFFLLLHGGYNVGGDLKCADKIEVKIQPLTALFASYSFFTNPSSSA